MINGQSTNETDPMHELNAIEQLTDVRLVTSCFHHDSRAMHKACWTAFVRDRRYFLVADVTPKRCMYNDNKTYINASSPLEQ